MHLGQRNCQSVCLKTLLINKIISNRYPPVNLYIDVEKPPILDLFPRKTHGFPRKCHLQAGSHDVAFRIPDPIDHLKKILKQLKPWPPR